MTKLFLSYTALVREMASNSVSEEDLETGIFYFGCTREHVYDPQANELNWLYDQLQKAVVHRRIMRAVRQAEAEGRVAFLARGESRSMKTLQELLERVGVNIRGWEEVAPSNGIHPIAIEQVANHFGLDVEVCGVPKATRLRGDCTKLRGDCSGLLGN